MTNFAVQSGLGSIAPFISKDKGSFGNRANCAGAQLKNEVKNDIESVAVLAGGIGTYSALNKLTKGKAFEWNTKINKALKDGVKYWIGESRISLAGEQMRYFLQGEKGYRAFLDHAKENGLKFPKLRYHVGKAMVKMVDGIAKVANKLSKTSGRQKILGGVVLATGCALNYVASKHNYKAGQIDQKYTDRAKMEKNAV